MNFTFLKLFMKGTTLVLLMSSLFIAVQAQEKVSFGLSFNHQALSVKNVIGSAAFYRDILGLEEIINRTEKQGIKWFSLNDGKELHLISLLPGEIKINKAVHLALTTTRFADFIIYLEKKNVNYSDWPGAAKTVTTRADGIKQIYLQDPDRYRIKVNSVAVK